MQGNPVRHAHGKLKEILFIKHMEIERKLSNTLKTKENPACQAYEKRKEILRVKHMENIRKPYVSSIWKTQRNSVLHGHGN